MFLEAEYFPSKEPFRHSHAQPPGQSNNFTSCFFLIAWPYTGTVWPTESCFPKVFVRPVAIASKAAPENVAPQELVVEEPASSPPATETPLEAPVPLAVAAAVVVPVKKPTVWRSGGSLPPAMLAKMAGATSSNKRPASTPLAGSTSKKRK